MGKCSSIQKKPINEKTNLFTSAETISSQEFESLKIIPKFPISSIAKESIFSSLSNSHIFNNITKDSFSIIMKHIIYCIAEPSKTIFDQGTKGTLFFVINSGQVEIIIDGNKKCDLDQGACFGEMALLSDSIRKATVKTTAKSSFWVLSETAFSRALKSIFKKTYDRTRKLIKNTIFFKNLPDSAIDLITKVSSKNNYAEREVVLREGDAGDLIYIINSGKVEFRKGPQGILVLERQGEIFGEGALLTGGLRILTCVCLAETSLISINLSGIKTALGEHYESVLFRNVAKNSITSDFYFKFIDLDKVIEICVCLDWRKLKENEVVFKKTKSKLKMFYVVCVGSIWVFGVNSSTINSYQAIGLRNINEQNLVEGEYVAAGDCIIGEIPVSKIDEILGIDTTNMFQQWDAMNLLKSFNFLSCLDLESIRDIATYTKTYTVLKDTKVFGAENRSSKVYFVKSGKFEIYDSADVLVRIATSFDVFGEKCLFEDRRTASVYCVEEGEFLAIHKSDLKKIKEIKDLINDAIRRDYYQQKVNIPNCVVVQEYSNIYNRRRFCIKTGKNKYQLIIVQKSSLFCTSDCLKLAQEKNIMLQVEHSQLLKLVCSHSDLFNIYFVTENINGKPLISLFPLSEKIAKSMTLHFVKIIDYLHKKNIIYRDFCPDNIIISSAGIPYLFNFKSAKIEENRTYTKLGSPFYRSPEMILSRGYTKSTDVWSLGVVIFEMIYGKLPFSISYNDPPADVYEKILNTSHGFNDSLFLSANNLLKRILCDTEKRIDLFGITRNQWFSINDRETVGRRLSKCPNVFNKEISETKHEFRKVSASFFMAKLSQNLIAEEVENFEWSKYF